MSHQCNREKIVWEKEPRIDEENVVIRGKCPVCERKYEQVFVQVQEGLWDVEKGEYVNI